MPDVVIIGAGQAGLAASVCLSRLGIDHVVLEKHEIGASWRRQRWDSFCLVTPNWTVRLPGQEYGGPDPDGFMSGGEFIEILERYADRFNVPVQCGTEVTNATPLENGWQLATNTGVIETRAVIVATSTYQAPSLPAFASNVDSGIVSMSAADYRSADNLPPGGVLVVGSAQSGGQIVEDLLIDGRNVVLSVSRAGRVPRRYRGRDAIEWQDLLGFLDRPASALENGRQRFGGEPHMTGRDGGHTVSLQNFHAQGVTLVGRIKNAEGSILKLDKDLHSNMVAADRFATNFCHDIDAYIQRTGLSAPRVENEINHAPLSAQDGFDEPDRLNLSAAGITSIVWATGFKFDFSWIAGAPLDEFGYPVTARGETTARGLYFLGLNFLQSRKSGIIYGVGDDALHVAERIHRYLKIAGS